MHTLKDLLNIAIQAEVNAQKLYARGKEIARDTETKNFLNRLYKEEIQHEKMLYNIRETGLYDVNVEIKDESLFPKTLSAHGGENISYEENWDIRKILDVALKREFTAQKRYEAAAESVENAELKELFRNLAKEEENHHRTVDKQYRLLTGLMGDEI